jgi:hypothetical protein
MVATPQKLLVIISDKHYCTFTGYAEHPIVSTLALDTLAAPGTGVTAAYTPSPICVSARASLGGTANKELQSAADRPRLAPVERAPLAIWGVATVCHGSLAVNARQCN